MAIFFFFSLSKRRLLNWEEVMGEKRVNKCPSVCCFPYMKVARWIFIKHGE